MFLPTYHPDITAPVEWHKTPIYLLLPTLDCSFLSAALQAPREDNRIPQQGFRVICHVLTLCLVQRWGCFKFVKTFFLRCLCAVDGTSELKNLSRAELLAYFGAAHHLFMTNTVHWSSTILTVWWAFYTLFTVYTRLPDCPEREKTWN